MCRHAAYIGPGTTLAALMWDLPHSLRQQAAAPRELLVGTVCADGFGVGWYDPDTRPEPARYASPMPLWSDASVASFGPLVRSGVIVAAVRNATVPGTTDAANCAPFAMRRLLFSHNGYLEDFDAAWKETVRGWIGPAQRRLVRGNTDSEHLAAALATRMDGRPGAAGGDEGAGEAPSGGGADAGGPGRITHRSGSAPGGAGARSSLRPRGGGPPANRDRAASGASAPDPDLATAVQSLLRDILAYADAEGLRAHLNLLVSDGDRLVAGRAGNFDDQNSLYHLADGAEFPDAHVVASEPLYDDEGWQPVPEDTILVLLEGAPPVRLRV